MTYFIPAGGDSHFILPKPEVELEPVFTVRPAIRRSPGNPPQIKMPRSVNRTYSDSELSTARQMLDLLRNRADVIEPLRASDLPQPISPDRALDVVVERLMDRLQ